MVSGHYISSGAGRIFLTIWGDASSSRVILCLPPLFEEMNLSRAVIAKQAQYFAGHGLTTCLLDYYGTGDSEGEIGEASVEIWLEDILTTLRWLQSRGVDTISLWGVRFGGLMQLRFQEQLHATLPVSRQLLWRPVLNGELLVKQFLRLKHLGAVLKGGGEKTDWRQRVREGEAVEVAGYGVSEPLLRSIEPLQAADGAQPGSPVAWMELAAPQVTPLSRRVLDRWPPELFAASAEDVTPFWQTPEIFSVPELYPRSLAMLQG